MMNFDVLMHDINTEFLNHSGTQRYGQFMMNYLNQHHSEIQIPSECDCFYDNSKVPTLINYLHQQFFKEDYHGS